MQQYAVAACETAEKKGNKLIDYFVFFLLQTFFSFPSFSPQRLPATPSSHRAIIPLTNDSIIEILNFAKTIWQKRRRKEFSILLIYVANHYWQNSISLVKWKSIMRAMNDGKKRGVKSDEE